jgi:hypothetical protein
MYVSSVYKPLEYLKFTNMKNSNLQEFEMKLSVIEALYTIRKYMRRGMALPSTMVIEEACCQELMAKFEKRVNKILGGVDRPKMVVVKTNMMG